MPTIRIALVGVGKIAHDQHLPAIAGDPDCELAATVSRNAPGVDGVPHYTSFDGMLAARGEIDAVALCVPPQPRYDLAARAIAAGKHVFLEKPPGATLSEVALLTAAAREQRVTLFASWHSRFAAGVAPARAWLADRQIQTVSITWREDVRVWHPGQDWIWQPGGLGVFDPGINALSIATSILQHPIFLRTAHLALPANRAAPIAATLAFSDAARTSIVMDLDWRQTGPQSWDIVVETDAGTCRLSSGGAVLDLPVGLHRGEDREYPGLYAHFAKLVRTGQCDVDTIPLQLVADAFMCGERYFVEPFEWET